MLTGSRKLVTLPQIEAQSTTSQGSIPNLYLGIHMAEVYRLVLRFEGDACGFREKLASLDRGVFNSPDLKTQHDRARKFRVSAQRPTARRRNRYSQIA